MADKGRVHLQLELSKDSQDAHMFVNDLAFNLDIRTDDGMHGSFVSYHPELSRPFKDVYIVGRITNLHSFEIPYAQVSILHFPETNQCFPELISFDRIVIPIVRELMMEQEYNFDQLDIRDSPVLKYPIR